MPDDGFDGLDWLVVGGLVVLVVAFGLGALAWKIWEVLHA